MNTQKPKRLLSLLALLLTLGLVAAACGSDAVDSVTDAVDDAADDVADAADDVVDEAEDVVDDAMDEADEAMDEADEAMDEADEAMDEAMDEVTALSVALVAPSASDDVAFTQSMVDSLAHLGVEPQVTDGTFNVDEAAAAIRAYAEDGINAIVVHGTQYGGSLAEIAPDFPEASFIWGTSTSTNDIANVFAYNPEADQGGYVLGYIAAGIDPSIGIVGPVEAGDAVAYIEGFKLGAVANGASDPSVVYTGSFSDVALATSAAQAHADNGVGVMTGTSQSAVGAASVAADNDIAWFGTQSNTETWSPDLTVASQVYRWDVVLAEMFALIEEGTLGGEVFSLTLENGGLDIEYNDAYELDADLKSEADALIDDIIAGTVATK
ncbi:MAG: BMP family ABC transporter substrate-binding protein [Acidimicrobiia bacterium]|nr:BMP family ABC transporter substrate-binding protein [Acidimicrobiia bacterium]